MHQEPDDFRSNFLNTRKVHGVFRNFDLLYSRQLQKFVSIVLKMRQGIFQAYRDYIRLFAKQLAGQGFDVSLYQKPSLNKNSYPITNLLYLMQVVGGQEHGQSLLPAELTDQGQKLPNPARVNTECGLVQYDDFRFPDQYVGQTKTLFHTPGVSRCFLVDFLFQTDEAQRFYRSFL